MGMMSRFGTFGIVMVCILLVPPALDAGPFGGGRRRPPRGGDREEVPFDPLPGRNEMLRARLAEQGPPQEEIDAAVERGVAWLKSLQQRDGSFPGFPEYESDGGCTALCLLAMVECGVPRDDPVVEKGLEFLRSRSPINTYSTGVLMMLLEALNREVIEGEGLDDYSRREVRLLERDLARDQDWMERLRDWMLQNRVQGDRVEGPEGAYGPEVKSGIWRYPGQTIISPGNTSRGQNPNWPYEEDFSNTQFAVLGLLAAERMDVEVPDDVWFAILYRLLETKRADPNLRPIPRVAVNDDLTYNDDPDRADTPSGWAYCPDAPAGRDPIRPVMTTIGVCSLSVIQARLRGHRSFSEELQARAEQSIYDGLAWLGNDRNYSIETPPPVTTDQYHIYYLYGLERVGMICGVENIGKHFWYNEGGTWLLSQQAADGSWNKSNTMNRAFGIDHSQPSGNPADTCFALLFLKRATRPVGVEYQVGGE